MKCILKSFADLSNMLLQIYFPNLFFLLMFLNILILILIKSSLSCFPFMLSVLCPEKSLHIPSHEDSFQIFPGSFTLNPSSQTFRSMIHLELIFTYSMRKGLRLLTPISIFSRSKTFAKKPFLSLFNGLGDMGLFLDSFLFRSAFVVLLFSVGLSECQYHIVLIITVL